jgi:hypothetical protein
MADRHPEHLKGVDMIEHQRFVLVSALVLANLLPSPQVLAQAVDFVRTTANTPIATSSEFLEIDRVIERQMGVAGRDVLGHKMGPNIAKRTGLGLNWYPLDIYKQTLCGALDRFGFYDGAGAEADWNNFIIPGMGFEYILEDARSLVDEVNDPSSSPIQDCAGGENNCVEGEVTPDEHFYENPWFTRTVTLTENFPGIRIELSSVREGRPLCTYGPWVWEEAHGNRPEIHPSEMYWWSEETGAASESRHILMTLQDDSNRFDNTDNYNGNIVRPWSKFPRINEFKVAFILNPQNEFLEVSVSNLAARHIVTREHSDAGRDSDDGNVHALVYNTRTVLRVSELRARDDDIGIRFDDLRRSANGDRLQGNIAITSALGRGDRGEEGYHVILVTTKRHFSITLPTLPEAVISEIVLKTPAKVHGSRESLTLREGAQLTGDLAFQVVDGDVLGVVRPPNIFSGGLVKLESPTGGSAIDLPPIALVPQIRMREPHSSRDTNAWGNFAKASGASAAAVAPLDLRKFQQLQFEISPTYALVRNNEPSLEEDSPFVEELNEVIEDGKPEAIRRLWGAETPIADVNYSFEAKDVVTGEAVPVRVGAFAARDIGITILPSEGSSPRLQVDFPQHPESTVYELKIKAEMRDTLGNKGVGERSVWSHGLDVSNQDDDFKRTALILARLIDLPSNDLLSASSLEHLPDDGLGVSGDFHRCARLVHLYFLGASEEDHTIGLDEWRHLLALSKSCAERH